jgi:hypothetical protein
MKDEILGLKRFFILPPSSFILLFWPLLSALSALTVKATITLTLNPKRRKARRPYEKASSQEFHNVGSAVNRDSRFRCRSI